MNKLKGFKYLISGARDPLFIPEGAGILLNVMDNCRTDLKIRKAREFIRTSGCQTSFFDSSGFHALRAEKNGKKITFDYSRCIINNEQEFNLATEHVIEKQEKLGATISTNLDWPVKKTKNLKKQEADFEKKFKFNRASAVRTAKIIAERMIPVKLFLGIQGYNLSHFDNYLDSYKGLSFDGVCFPVRNSTLEQMGSFFIRARQKGIKAIHVFGTGSFINLALYAYLARNLVDFVSVDGTGWRYATGDKKVMHPLTLYRMKVDENKKGVFMRNCGCKVCQNKMIGDAQITPWESRAVHNCFSANNACEMLYQHSKNLDQFERYVMKNDPYQKPFWIQNLIKAVRKIEMLRDAGRSDLERYLS